MKKSEIEKYQNIFLALSNKIRLDALLTLKKAKEIGIKLNSQEVFETHNLPRSSMSHHLDYLVGARLITKTKKGKEVLIELSDSGFSDLTDFLMIFKP